MIKQSVNVSQFGIRKQFPQGFGETCFFANYFSVIPVKKKMEPRAYVLKNEFANRDQFKAKFFRLEWYTSPNFFILEVNI